MPYVRVSSSYERSATASLRCRVTAMPCCLFSSMQPTTTAAPKARSSGATRSKRSSPSSRLIELTMALPWQWRSASSRTAASVESIISGTFTRRVSSRMKRSMSAASSRSGLARHTSSTWAEARTWARPISAASSKRSVTISSLNFRADDVGTLAHEHRTVVVGRIEDLDAAHGLGLDGRGHARRLAGHEPRDRADVLRRGATAAAHEVDPALVHEPRELEGQALRRLAVLAALVGQPRVGIHARPARGDRGQRAQVVGHELGPGRTVEPDREEPEVLERDVERLDALTREHGAHGLDGRRDHQRYVEPARGALGAPYTERGGLEVQGVLRRLQQQRVHAA